MTSEIHKLSWVTRDHGPTTGRKIRLRMKDRPLMICSCGRVYRAEAL